MEIEGPSLETLTHRLTEVPEDFLAEPRISGKGRIQVAAVVGDLLASFGDTVNAAELAVFLGENPGRDRNRLSIALLLCWLLADDWFRENKQLSSAALTLLSQGSAELAAQVAARKFVTDPNRREELARFALARLGYRPAGESAAQAQDRLTSLSSTERARVMSASRAAEERARTIREALARKAAQESADKWSRE